MDLLSQLSRPLGADSWDGTKMAGDGMKSAACFLVAVGVLVFSAPAQAAYYVYCLDRHITVRPDAPDAMRRRFSGVCARSGALDLSAAERLAKQQFGGYGARCSC